MKRAIPGAILTSGLIIAGQVVLGDPAIAQEVKQDYSVSQQVWSEGMHSGEGNFLQNCTTCHGMEGKGDGPLAESLGGDIRPRDLSDKALLSTRTDEFLFKVIKYGGKPSGLSEVMPDWGESFDDDAIRSIVRYMRLNVCKCKYEGGGSN